MDVEIIQTKDCEFCYRSIDYRASRCPYCCGVLVKPNKLTVANFVTYLSLVLFAGLAILGWRSVFALSSEVEDYRQTIAVLDGQLATAQRSLKDAEPPLNTPPAVDEVDTERSDELSQLTTSVNLSLQHPVLACSQLVSNLRCLPDSELISTGL